MVDAVTHAHEGGVVIFQIGMVVRKPHRVDLWVPVAAAMTGMLRELRCNTEQAARGEAEDLGFMGGVNLMGVRGPWAVQYWRTVEHLYAYAVNPDNRHLPAWRKFNRAARANPGVVGVWHETYVVPPGGIETLYGNGALVGLGAVTGTVPIEKRGLRAAQRLGSAFGGASGVAWLGSTRGTSPV
ncbi:MAG: DUF4188 domain-containing protein [Kocuria sp.]|nr:DUF4188 domain-containing protein [Kocuria sp.]